MVKPITVELKVADMALRDIFSDMARLHLDHRPFAKAGKIIVIACDGRTAFVVARGPAGIGKGTIALDSATRERLNVRPGETRTFTIKKGGFWAEARWAWDATDAMPRVAARLGAISVGLGFVGAIFGVASLIITLCQQSAGN